MMIDLDFHYTVWVDVKVTFELLGTLFIVSLFVYQKHV